MSILIKNMNIPKDEPLLVKINPDGSVSTTARNGYKKYEAVELPPHGRTIDADAIPYNKIMLEDDDFYYGVTKPYIDRMPTIIEAENPFFESLKAGLEQAINGDVRETIIEEEGEA